MNDAISQFRTALSARGILAATEIRADGVLHRCDAEGKGGKNDAAYLLHLDGIPAGGFENHRDGLGWENWRADIGRTMTPAEDAEHRAKVEVLRKQREIDQAKQHAEARERAGLILAETYPGDHPYLIKKAIKSFGAKVIGAEQARGIAPNLSPELTGRLLVIPVRADGVLASLQFITADGIKRPLTGGKMAGGYHAIGTTKGAAALAICEGFATGATIHEATGYPVAVAFSAGNLLAVAQAMRAKFSDLPLIVCADDDLTAGNPGLTKATEAARALGGVVAVPAFGADRCEKDTDFNDLAAMHGLEAVARVISGAVMGEPAPEADNAPDTNLVADSEDEKVSQASALVAFVEGHAELFHDQNGDVFAEAKDTHETRRLDGRQFKDWLVSHFYEKTGKSPRDQSTREALSTLAGLGRFRGECRDVFIRVAMHENDYFLDLAEPGKNRAVRISAGQWEVVTNAPVRFIRPETMRPLPEPKHSGNLDMLWKIANIPNDSRLLILAWLGECLRPDTPFPVLELMGEQGSAKSTTQTALRRLIDPNACDLRSAPKAVEDMFVGAGASWLVSYENISHLSAPMQDALCVLATGGGFAKRKLYSDAEESVITVKRPVVLNGISVAVTAQDLVDRTLSIETPVIRERVETTELWRNFDAAHGELLGALLDVVAAALDLLPNIRIPAAERPRLAEFARFGMAVAEAAGKTANDFTRQFTACRQEAIARTLDASPVATAVLAWCEQNPFGAKDTAGNFMNRMEAFKPQRVESWPWSAKGFADALRRAAPALRQHGIECRSLPKTGGVIRWEIGPREKFANPCPECPDHPAECVKQDMQDMQDIVQELSPATVEDEI